MIFKSLVKVAFLGLVLTTVSCGGDKPGDNIETVEGFNEEQFLINLEEIENSLNVEVHDKNDLQKAVTSYQDFANHFPEDEKAPDYLMQASDFAFTLGQYEKSVRILNQIIDEYPDYDQMLSVCYSRASHTDFELRDTATARQYYIEVQEKYPNTQQAIDAQTRIDQNFMTPEELIEMWTKNPVEDVVQ
jgi:tetratricopeptide (TPR) repeat protein